MREPDPGSRTSPGGEGTEALRREEQLVRQAQAGDRQALETLLLLHADALFAQVILPRVGERAVAEDLLKATLVTAMEKLRGFAWQGCSVYFWLRRIAVNKVVDHYRAERRALRLCEALAREPEPACASEEGGSPEAALIALQERRLNEARLRTAMQALNPRYRQAVELRLVEERPREACARELGITVGNFDVVLFRALKALRKQLGDP